MGMLSAVVSIMLKMVLECFFGEMEMLSAAVSIMIIMVFTLQMIEILILTGHIGST